MRFPRVPGPRSLAAQLFAMQAVLIAFVVAGCALFTYLSDRSQAEDAAGRQAMAVARSVADAPSVRAAILTAPKPTTLLQPYALQVQHHTDVDFVTIMNPEGIRWTHPDKQQIGQRFLGHRERALRGESFTEVFSGTLGPSVRAVTPIHAGGANSEIIGLVSAGIRVEEISARVQDQVTALFGVAAGALALGAIGTYVVNARLRRHTHGMNAAELSRMHDYHQAALHAVREGLLMLDGQYRVALMNDGGRELLGVTDEGEVVGRSVAELGLPAPLTGALLSAEPRVDEVHLTADRVLVVNTSTVSSGERRGTVVTLRDVTELQSLMGELDSERGFTQALRSQAHEAANRLHTVVSLIELDRAEEAVDFATAELELAQALTDQVVAAVSEPVLAALLLGKTAQANERGVELVVSEDSSLDDGLLPDTLPARDLVTILGNLIDNAVDAAQGSAESGLGPSRVTVTALTEDSLLVLRVSDTGAGVDPAHTEAVFQRGFTTKPAGPGGRGLGLALVRQAVARHEGTLTVAEAAGGGAEFEVRLPLPKVAAPAPTSGPASSSDGHTPAEPTEPTKLNKLNKLAEPAESAESAESPEHAEPALPGGDV
ncbi:ATP-binding protein [Streptomyces turgidiscabies]|uniref:histidine kinase n=1 Tax=Streptomyces turgidiscabies (strain Car8) TaxID=698760 RepID=L7FE94_STRT8|nr:MULTISPECIES: sensor histidine kinase [Streptomyces]ELP69005.1 ATPase/histidine kinase/DNA gyrase B/HSP90 domain protein [Streptomyces turgidiscabies Car8]MDX3495666.1 sensor histidine kinase [Streptomyces turgidiscabies]GAQ70357.1 sensor histidine kinase DcuS [Streptomyces turgidiscabies]